ncbi:YIP1 family protein [Paenibacillus sp. GCM10027626]|uniref:YIP1 family protein n=1 Tax=Paenibacillus sp. GCM10027626 TaxID=3273411 RepID=UPI0036365C77
MMKRLQTVLLAIGLLLGLAPSTVSANLPFKTFYRDAGSDHWSWIQAVYVPEGIVTLSLEEPTDLFIAGDDVAYVVDRKTNRVVVVQPDGSLKLTIGDDDGPGALNAPEGVFVAKDGTVYVADTGNERIVLFTGQGKFIREYKKPDSAYLPSDTFFVPSKIVVDKRGVMYIAISGSEHGLLRMDREGRYTGAFGANKAEQSYSNWLKHLILNKEQLEKEVANRPRPITNMTIDPYGFLFTASAGRGSGNIRKLNPGGLDSLRNRSFQNAEGIVDLAVDRDGFIYNIDTVSASITLYDPYGNAIFSFGDVNSDSQRKGVFGFPTSIAVNSGYDIWVADSKLKNVQIFKRTPFGANVMTAAALYTKGLYEESEPYWRKVSGQNDMFNMTFQGLGKIDLHEKQYEQALGQFKLAYDTEGYSQAFWEVRYSWLQQHLIELLVVLAALFLIVKYGSRRAYRFACKLAWPRLLVRYWGELKDLGYVLIHPYHGFYKLKERAVSWVAIGLILLLAVGLKLLSLYFTGFLFNPIDTSQINLSAKMAFFIVPWATWIIANYLVCSVRGGEGRLREVVQASAYALAPYVLFSLPILLLSNLVTLDERVLVDAFNQAMMIWMLVLFFVSTQVIHNFEFVETIRNSSITVFTIVIIWFFAFIVSGLSYNLYDFFTQLYREVIFYA